MAETAQADRSVQRIDRARRLLESAGVGALVVSRPENVRYLCGFTGSSSALLVAESDAVLVTDSRYAEQSASEAPAVKVHVASGPPAIVAAGLTAARRRGFEAEALTYDAWERIAAGCDAAGAVLVPCRGLIEGLRAIKGEEELPLIERAIAIAADALEAVLPLAVPGAVERDLALELEVRMKQEGAEEVAFPLIVASGPRSALPHGRASGKRLAAGEFVVFDIGARHEGYHSDMTRTVFMGAAAGEQRRLYETVREAQLAAIETIAPGVKAADVDRAARAVIESAGFGERFGHGTGHGVGLEVHEAPRVGPRSEDLLQAGMVVTVEPGIYLPGEAGVRIEDMVLVTPEGHRVLTPRSAHGWSVAAG